MAFFFFSTNFSKICTTVHREKSKIEKGEKKKKTFMYKKIKLKKFLETKVNTKQFSTLPEELNTL